MKNGKLIFLTVFSALALWPSISEAISLEVKSRGPNGLGLASTDPSLVSLEDCLDGVALVIEVKLESASTDGRSLYLYEGSSCDTAPAECNRIGEAQSPAILTFTVPANDLVSGCSSSTTADLWVGLLQEEDQPVNDDGAQDGIWSTAAKTITFDFDPPTTVPTGLKATVGSENVKLSWTELGEGEVAGFRVVYWSGEGLTDTDDTESGSDADADSDGDTDTDVDTDTDTDVDASVADDAGTKSGAGAMFAVRAADDDGGVDEECTVQGGFTEGGAYDHTLISGFDDGVDDSASATSVTIGDLENGVQYKFAVVSLDKASNPSAFSEVICATPERTIGFGEIYSNAGGKGDGKYCFIATAAFGSYDHPTVRALRSFRDDFLAPLPGGETIIQAYYAVGPTLARFVEGDEELRGTVREALTIVSGGTRALSALGPTAFGFGFATCLFAGLVIGLALPRRRRGE